MKNYAVFLHGENFDIHYKGKKQLVGFFTTIRIEAESDVVAGYMAVRMIESDSELAEAYAPDASIKPTIEVKVIHELESSNRMKDTAYTMFYMDEV